MKRLIATNKSLYDNTGTYLGKEVIEVDAYTEEELRPHQCSECGAAGGAHREHFIKTGQCGAGSVEGRYQQCSKGKR